MSTITPAITTPDGFREEAVRFFSGDNTLVGNLAGPAEETRTAVVFVHGWSGVRSGPNGLLTKLAREFASAGLTTLRFDLGGRGESEGDGLNVSLATMADDVVAACRYVENQCHPERLLILGLCSGGNVTIGALPRIKSIGGLLLLSVYPFSEGDAFGRDVNRTVHYLRVYWMKLWRIDTWKRLIRGELFFRQILNVLFGHYLQKRGAEKKSDQGRPKGSTAAGTASKAAKEEGRHSKAPPKTHLEKLKCGVPALMVYGTADPDAPAGRTYFESFVSKHKLPIEFAEIPGANHNFSSRDWEAEVTRLCLEFCGR